MSLKAFHIFFITLSILLAFGFGVWGLTFHFQHGNVSYFVMGLLSIWLGIVLIFYEIKFLRKLKYVSLM